MTFPWMVYLNFLIRKPMETQRSYWNQERSKTFRMNSFCVRSINKWNPLPDDINSKIVRQFKTLYDRHRDSGNSSQKSYINQFIIIIITIYWNSIYLFIRQHPQLSITCRGIRPSFYSKLIWHLLIPEVGTLLISHEKEEMKMSFQNSPG